jgi:hypothetical protein
MAIWYIDPTSGNDTTGDGSSGNPYKTENKVTNSTSGVGSTGDEVRVAKTAAPSSIAGVANFLFTNNSFTITTDADARGSLAVGNYIGKPSASGNGATETYYRISAITANTITLNNMYYGTTESVASVKKLNPVTQVQGQSTVIQTQCAGKTFNISGGWDLSTLLQDGETWVTPSFARTTNANYYSAGASGVFTLSKMNYVDTYGLMTGDTASTTINNCCVYTYRVTTRGSISFIIEDTTVFVSEPAGSNNFVITTESPNTYHKNNYYNSIYHMFYFNIIIKNFYFENCLFVGNTGGDGAVTIEVSGSVIDLKNSVFSGCNRGLSVDVGGTIVKNATAKVCANGFILDSVGAGDVIFENCSTESCTQGIDVAGNPANMTILGGTSLNDGYGVYNDSVYARNLFISGRTFTTPTNYAVRVVENFTPTILLNCTIDVASQSKLVYEIETGQLITPIYIVSRCTNALNGIYHSYYNAYEDDANYRTIAPGYTIVFKSTISNNSFPHKFWSAFVDTEKSYTISCYMKKNVAWLGSIIPVITLDGETISTETEITSLTTDYVKHSWTIDSDDISHNGELALNFILNCNTSDLYFDDFEIEEIEE